ncbi:predicted protein [Aspergillus nidulans FGSC A4]|uniref:Uncharacterized protein n=1 Tax=Emericella nidulans (strain FGSC A4 / ATCC 38163 / CBS 112.46 / NRRL 194 / M139) TaxID=227321 RepID=Q5BCE0_EMENI|nr:hypothetical protein [Aspergillus nidulans FGSC A4]EAA63966.1 predicted protein [Aspergillus nidulans FGSC A4]CBF85568.1 TPA: conserved hypothetical protein [Aspergillus nidulans FGSC A4]|eukprot:XP_659394.1 predicted protein [Aspergillus nidulans FGSC A4]
MAGPCQLFYLEDLQAKDPHKASDEQSQIRVPSIDSTVISINSPRIEASSVASSLTLVDEPTTMGPPAYGKLFYGQNRDEELAPRPLRPRRSVQSSLPDVEPPSYTQLATKPLPPTPSLSRDSRMQRTTSPPVDRGNVFSPISPLSRLDMAIPELERPRNVVATNQAVDGPGCPTKPTNSSTICVFCLDVEQPSASGRTHESLAKSTRETARQVSSTPTEAVPLTTFSHEAKDISSKARHNSVLTRAFQRLWPAKLIRHRNPAIRPSSASAHRPPTPFVRVEPHTQRQPRPAGAAPPTPITRMKRVLSVLMDERMSLYLNNLVAAAVDESLIRDTQVLVVDSVQSARPSIQGSTCDRSPVDHPSLRRPVCSLYELDGHAKKISPPAWELREIKEAGGNTEKPGNQAFTANLYLRHYTRDLIHLANIKFLLQDHCEPLLNKDMVAGLRDPYDTRAERVDAAIWRVWIFCQLFGNRKDRENDFQGQSRWLRGQRTTGALELPQVCRTSPDPADFNTVLFSPPDGFAQGNPATGLSRQQLLDMVDIWVAMGQLMECLRKQTRLARQHGVFDSAETPPNTAREELRMLRAWLDFILTLGPAAVLELVPAGPNSDPARAFGRAKANGWTQWSPPPLKAPRSNFLVGIVRSLLQTMPDNDFDGNAI